MLSGNKQYIARAIGDGSTLVVHRHEPSIYWPLVITALILYGSCIPFQFDFAAYEASNAWGLFSISLRKFDLNDLITNIAVYIPFGILWMRYWNSRRRFSFSSLFIVGVAGVALSVIVESLQAGITHRYASWCDVVFNGFGTMTGAVLFFTVHIFYHAKQHAIRQQWKTNPYYVAAFALTLGLFCYELMPFDFLTSSTALHSAFHRAQWLPLITGDLLTHTSLTADLTDRLIGATWFALLGFLLATSHRNNKQPSINAIGYALFHGVILVSVIECMQLFTRSHVFELEAILFRSLAVFFGSWGAAYIVDIGERKILQSPGKHRNTVYFFISLAIIQLLILIVTAVPFDQWFNLSLSQGNFHWMPFETLWHEPFQFATAKMLAVFMAYATLSLTLLMIMPRINRQQTTWIVCTFIFYVAFFIEVTQWLTGSGTPDITTPIIAGTSALIASRVYFTLQALPKNAHVK